MIEIIGITCYFLLAFTVVANCVSVTIMAFIQKVEGTEKIIWRAILISMMLSLIFIFTLYSIDFWS